MLNRSISDGSHNSNATSSSSLARTELMVTAPSSSVELPLKAVSAVSTVQPLPEDHQRLNQETKALGRIRSAIEAIHASRDDLEKLEELREKLMLSYQRLGETEDASADAGQLFRELEASTDFLLGAEVREEQRQHAGLTKPLRTERLFIPEERDKIKVLNQIDSAINRVGQLQQKLGQFEKSSFDNLLNLNLSVNGLNVARSQVDDSHYSVSAASTAVENILINVRTAVVAHGGVSADLVRLVINT